MRPAAKIPYGGKSTAIFGLVLITIFWLGTTQRSAAEQSEAYSSEHSKNANLALDIANRAYVLETGEIVTTGTAADVRNDDAVRKAYLGY